MKTTAQVRKEIIGIHGHSPEGEDRIIDEILESYAKEIANKQRHRCFDSVAGINIPVDAYDEGGNLDFKKVIKLILNTPLVTEPKDE